MGHNVIATSQGFLSDRLFDPNTRTYRNLFSKNFRNAKIYKSAQTAKSAMERMELEGFVFNPFSEESTPVRYLVVEPHYGSLNPNNFYTVEASFKTTVSDLDFVKSQSQTYETRPLYTREEAIRICKEKNRELIEEIQDFNRTL